MAVKVPAACDEERGNVEEGGTASSMKGREAGKQAGGGIGR